MQLATVGAEDEVGTRLDRRERPEPGVTPEVEHALARERAAAELDERVEEVPLALLVAVHVASIEDRRAHAVQVELVVPRRKTVDALAKLRLVHDRTP